MECFNCIDIIESSCFNHSFKDDFVEISSLLYTVTWLLKKSYHASGRVVGRFLFRELGTEIADQLEAQFANQWFGSAWESCSNCTWVSLRHWSSHLVILKWAVSPVSWSSVADSERRRKEKPSVRATWSRAEWSTESAHVVVTVRTLHAILVRKRWYIFTRRRPVAQFLSAIQRYTVPPLTARVKHQMLIETVCGLMTLLPCWLLAG